MLPIDRKKLVPPDGQTKVLLHSCCAPCSGEVMEAMTASGDGSINLGTRFPATHSS